MIAILVPLYRDTGPAPRHRSRGGSGGKNYNLRMALRLLLLPIRHCFTDEFHGLMHAISEGGHDICCLGFETTSNRIWPSYPDQNESITAIIEERKQMLKPAPNHCNSGLMAVKMPFFDLLAALNSINILAKIPH